MLHARYRSMSFSSLILCLSQIVLLASAREVAWVTTTTAAATTSSIQPESTACGYIIDQADPDITNNFFLASDVYDCLTSVPLNIDVALRFIEYYNTTLQFQSTLAFLENPPAGYQQPAIDVLQGLEDIRRNLTSGFYQNQYDFEVSLQQLVYGMHDAHVALEAGILSAFTFGSPYDIMSVSVDGKQLPQPYIAQDIIDSTDEGWNPSPITEINGEDATTYLTRFAAINSFGRLDPHADWNQLMYTPVQDILGTGNTFGWEAPYYPGDALNFTFANGTELDTEWLAIYQNYYRTGPLTTGGDFYNYFVLGFLPASFTGADLRPDPSASDDNSTDTTSTVNATSWANVSAAYPSNPDIVQPELSVTGGGYLTGYFLNSSSTGVLSIPSFQEYGDVVGTFSQTVHDFIERAQSAGLQRIVIDLQQNAGGSPLLAFDTFAQFFPNIDPFAGSRRRVHDLANVLGTATTNFWLSLTPDNQVYNYSIYHDAYAAEEWVIANRLNAATNQTFESWQQYQGPIVANGDDFSLTERYNLSDTVFDSAAFDGWLPAGYDGSLRANPPPFAATNIILLMDGACSSTCTLFSEMMTHEAGVRTVVVGGSPITGPMQAASGTRGAIEYSADILDSDFVFASAVNETANTTLPQVRDPGMAVSYAGFNLRDQVRYEDTTPLQFKYEAADCRIYYTMQNALNESRLWLDAAAAIWDDPSLCVEGSTGYSTQANSTSAPKLPPAAPSSPLSNGAINQVQSSSSTALLLEDDDIYNGMEDGLRTTSSLNFRECDGVCKCSYTATCPDGSPVKLCATSCSGSSNFCGGNLGVCAPSTQFESKFNGKGKGLSIQKKVTVSVCQPLQKQAFPGCPGVNSDSPY